MARYPHDERVKRVFRHTVPKGTIPPKRRLPEVTYAESDKFYKMQEIFSPRFIKYYKMKTKFKKKITLSRIKKFIKRFLRYMSKHIIGSKAGVFIKNFGYFFISRRPKRQVRKYRINGQTVYSKQIMNLGSHYLPCFIPIRKDGLMHQWTMDRAFSGDITSPLRNTTRLKQVDYSCALSLLIGTYGRKDLIIKHPNKIGNN